MPRFRPPQAVQTDSQWRPCTVWNGRDSGQIHHAALPKSQANRKPPTGCIDGDVVPCDTIQRGVNRESCDIRRPPIHIHKQNIVIVTR